MMAFLALGLIAAALAALLHVGFFVLESIAFERPAVRRLFGVPSKEQSRSLSLFAANQGVYNLALAIVVALGLALAASGVLALGLGLALGALAVMVVAALALVATSRRLWRGALIQGLPPAVAIAGLVTLLPAD